MHIKYMVSILTMIVLITVITLMMNSNTKLVNNNMVIHDCVNIQDVNKRIIAVHHVYESIQPMFNKILPITIKFSHWETVMELENNIYYLISSAHQGFVEIFSAVRNGANSFEYIYKTQKITCYILNTYVVDSPVTPLQYMKKLNIFIHKAQAYSLLHNNCMHATAYGIIHILDIGYRPELDVDTKLSNIFRSICNNFTKYKEC